MAQEEQPSSEYYFAHFRESFLHVWNKYVGDAPRTEIVTFLTSHITQIVMYQAFTTENVNKARDQVFHHEHVRDFVLSVAATFFTRVTKLGPEWNMLVERLVGAYAVDAPPLYGTEGNGSDAHRATPIDISSRLPEVNDIRQYLLNNRWLVVLAMIDQSMSLADILALAPQGKRK